jgi:hypothetical protein
MDVNISLYHLFDYIIIIILILIIIIIIIISYRPDTFIDTLADASGFLYPKKGTNLLVTYGGYLFSRY